MGLDKTHETIDTLRLGGEVIILENATADSLEHLLGFGAGQLGDSSRGRTHHELRTHQLLDKGFEMTRCGQPAERGALVAGDKHVRAQVNACERWVDRCPAL